MSLTLICTRTEKWLITKENVDWKSWQDKLYWFLTRLSFDNSNTLADFLRDDFHLEAVSKKYIVDSLSDNNKTYVIHITEGQDVKITPLQFDLLTVEGEIIDWEDWSYFFTKVSDKYILWVYLGGIADLVREINLSDAQIKTWKEKGNPFIKELATDLQYMKSKIYAEAIFDNRRIL